MLMNRRILRVLRAVCTAVLLVTALSLSAFAEGESIEDQMAANSAAWWVAYNAGDTETCEKLHQANVELAAQAAGETGSATFDSSSGTWDITTSEGGRIASVSEGQDGKNETITYTSQTEGSIHAASAQTYTDEAIAAYMQHGGTTDGLITSYNNAANSMSVVDRFGSETARTSADSEVAVVKAVLGLSDAEADQLKTDLEASKQEYESAHAAYKAAVAAGDEEGAAEAKNRMDAAHAEAEGIRSAYNYTGDSNSYEDGGYYYGGEADIPSDGGNGGGFYIIDNPAFFVITPSATRGGTISPDTAVAVTGGGYAAFSMQADSGYKLDKVLVDGSDVGSVTSYTFTNVRSSHTIQAVFVKNSYSITASASEGGSITPSGNQSVSFRDDASFSIMPDEGYHVSRVLVDGISVGEIADYTFRNVTEDHTIRAEFEKDGFTITASAGNGGSISPSGNTTVYYGDSQTYTIRPMDGYEVSAVTVDGQNKGRITGYTFSNVREPHSISVTFRVIPRVEIDDFLVTDSMGVSLAGRTIKSGYGIMVKVPVTADGIVEIGAELTYNFENGNKTVDLVYQGAAYVLPVNSMSPTGSRVVYIPVEAADGTYTLKVTVTGLTEEGDYITQSSTATVTVLGNMYEDDFTGDR